MAIEQFNKGEDIVLYIQDDETISSTALQRGASLSLLLYPMGTDLSVEKQRENIREASFKDGASVAGKDGSITTESNSIVVKFPYTTTKDMQSGAYTIEIVWFDQASNRSIMKQDNAITLVESAGHYMGVGAN